MADCWSCPESWEGRGEDERGIEKKRDFDGLGEAGGTETGLAAYTCRALGVAIFLGMMPSTY